MGKHPRTPHGLKDASTDPETIAAWWQKWPEANVGICTGSQSFIVLDVDAGHGGEESLSVLEMKHGRLPDTVEALTGGGGRHILFAHPGFVVRNKVAVAPGVDIRGDGGYIVAPPSVHASGRQYEWELSSRPGEVALAPMPAWLQAMLRTPAPAPPKKSSGDGDGAPIPKGQRDSTLASLAGSMRRRGMSAEEIAAALWAVNERRCRPPLFPIDITRIAASVGRYEPEPGGTEPEGVRYNRTDLGNAELLAELHGDGLRYDHLQGRWLVWREHWWQPDQNGEVPRLAKRTVRERFHRVLRLPEDLRKAEARWALGSENTRKIDHLLASAQSEMPFADAGDGWDVDPWLLGVANGVVDLRTGELRAGRQEDGITIHTDVEFNPDAVCPRWEEFVGEVLDGDLHLMDFVQRAVGYSLTADRREQCVFILHGSGANGKTVFLETLLFVFGPYGYASAFSTFEASRQASIPVDIAALERRRLVVASETRIGARIDEQRLKTISGGDTISARRLYQAPHEFKPVCAVWLGVNHRPAVYDDSCGFWRRIRLIPFLRKFEGTDADQLLGEKLRAEAAGILAWGVRGCLAWQAQRLEPPTSVIAATQDYEHESDPLQQWLAEHCTCDAAAETSSQNLHNAYVDWCDVTGYTKRERLTRTAWGRRMGERFAKGRDGRGRMIYRGIRLQDTAGI